ncbi:thioredoxin domain-containing protein [Herbiconiux sp. 11R-BC]|uniref:DsbA family protein n=1 Tax=Herbiconiux sp. 11R-BC TaxID=3111637 RepID=UPI003C0169AF
MSPAKSDKSIYDGLPKKDRQALARELARIQREEERRRRRRNRIILRSSLIVVGVAALAVAGVTIYNTVRATFVGPANMLSDGILFTGDGTNTTATATVALQPGETPVAQALDVSKVLRITEYIDYASADAAKFETANGAALQSYVTPGYASIELHPVALDGDGSSNSYSTRAANAVACVANTTPDAVLAVHNALIKAQSTLPEGGLTNDALVSLVNTAGATDAKIASCITGNEFDDWVKGATDRAKANVPNSDVTALTTVPLIVMDGTAYTGALDDTTALNTFITDVFGKATGAGSTATPTPTPTP